MSSWNQLETVVFCQASGRLPEGTIEDMAFHFVEDANEEYEPLVVDRERIRMDPMGLLDFVIEQCETPRLFDPLKKRPPV